MVVSSGWEKDKVAIVSGGGSGHEPFAAGLVGKGGITGNIFSDFVLLMSHSEGC